MFFRPAFYSVLEGEFLQIALQTNKHFEDPFTINVTIVEGTAVGKCLVHILHNTQYTADKALLIIRNTYRWEGGSYVYAHTYACLYNITCVG